MGLVLAGTQAHNVTMRKKGVYNGKGSEQQIP